MYFDWCSECHLTTKFVSVNGNYEIQTDHQCNCNSNTIEWNVLREFAPGLPVHPEKNIKYNVSRLEAPLSPRVIEVLREAYFD